MSFAQQTIVKGSVLDGTTGEPIPDVTVIIEGTELSAFTDAKGEFSFSTDVPLGDQVLKIENARQWPDGHQGISRRPTLCRNAWSACNRRRLGICCARTCHRFPWPC